MIRFLAILSLVIVVLFSLAACGEEANPTAAPAAAATPATAPAPLVAPHTSITRPPGSTSTNVDAMSPESLSAEEIASLVTEAVKERTADGVSAEEVQDEIEDVLSGVPEGITQSDIQDLIAKTLDKSNEEEAVLSALVAEEAAMASALVVMEERASQATATPQPTTIPAPAHAAQATPIPAPTAAPVPTHRSTRARLPPLRALQAQGTPSATTFQDYLRERFVSTAADSRLDLQPRHRPHLLLPRPQLGPSGLCR